MAPSDDVDIAGTVRERAARELRDRILTGALPAGTRLDLDAITKEFATSRTPVREALLELSYDGLVRVAPRSGVTVIGIRPEDVLDSFTILGVLTGQAAAWAARRVTPDGVARLRAPGSRPRIPLRRGRHHRRGWEFHREIHRAAHSRRLMAQIRQAVRVVPSNFLAMFPDHEHHLAGGSPSAGVSARRRRRREGPQHRRAPCARRRVTRWPAGWSLVEPLPVSAASSALMKAGSMSSAIL